MKKIELLAPAGNYEKLKIAFEYGADAVYAGAKKFSLRNLAENLSLEDFKRARDLALKKGKKIYITLNVFPYNEDLEEIENYIEIYKDYCDAFIVSDPGVVRLCKKFAPSTPIHLSTQANTTNYLSAKFWQDVGIKRINLARELSLEDIKIIKEKLPDMEIEVFIHGAMCMAISGRCLLSNFLTSRASNKGECTHPCRWRYFFMEETREGQIFEIQEDERGIYLFNSKDLCGIYYISQLAKMKVDSVKIEGRMKSIYYVANVVRVYREAIDSYYENPEKFEIKDIWIKELELVSHRGYTRGFFEKRNFLQDIQNINSSKYIRNAKFLGVVLEVMNDKVIIEARNRFRVGEEVEIISKNISLDKKLKINEMYDLDGNPLEIAQPGTLLYIPLKESKICELAIIRKPIEFV